MRNLDILAIASAYTKKKSDIKLPAPIAWKRRLNMDRIFRAKEIIDGALNEIRQKYADDDHSIPAEDGNGRQVKPEYIQEYATAQAEVLSQETPVDIEKIKIEDLGEIALTDTDMDTLAFMIKEEV